MSEAEIASTNAAADENRDDVIKHLKEQLAAKTTEAATYQASAATANERNAGYEARERTRIAGWQEEAKFFMSEFVDEEVNKGMATEEDMREQERMFAAAAARMASQGGE